MNTKNNNMKTYKNKETGNVYYSCTDEIGNKIYSFSKNFDESWTDDENADALGENWQKIIEADLIN